MNRFWALAALVMAAAAVSPLSAEETTDCHDPTGTELYQAIDSAIGIPESHKDHQGAPEANDDDQSAAVAKDTCPEPIVVCHEPFCTQYNGTTKQPDWVIERLTRKIAKGKHKRPDVDFEEDEQLPDGRSATDNHYKHSGLARGHQAASADFKSTPEWMIQTFVFSNAVPQIQHGFNGGIWRQLEDHVQKLAIARGKKETYIITGPVEMAADGGETVISEGANGCGNRIVLAGLSKLKKREICDANDKDPSKSCKNGVAVPAGLFKIVYLPESERAFGFLMSNEDHRNLKDSDQTAADYFEEWRATLSVIEEATSLKFFPDLSLRESNMRKTHCTETRWH